MCWQLCTSVAAGGWTPVSVWRMVEELKSTNSEMLQKMLEREASAERELDDVDPTDIARLSVAPRTPKL